jgi:hypothetical protein
MPNCIQGLAVLLPWTGVVVPYRFCMILILNDENGQHSRRIVSCVQCLQESRRVGTPSGPTGPHTPAPAHARHATPRYANPRPTSRIRPQTHPPGAPPRAPGGQPQAQPFEMVLPTMRTLFARNKQLSRERFHCSALRTSTARGDIVSAALGHGQDSSQFVLVVGVDVLGTTLSMVVMLACWQWLHPSSVLEGVGICLPRLTMDVLSWMCVCVSVCVCAWTTARTDGHTANGTEPQPGPQHFMPYSPQT